MYISDLALNDFRSYQEVVLHFEPGITTFVGENGQGKTNLVEAIGYLASFSSHRVGTDSALVRAGANAGVIRAKVWHEESPTTLEIEIISGRANRARINRGNVRPQQILGLVRTVLFAPEDLQLIKGDPSHRRDFLDLLMIQAHPKMAAVRSEYEKVLRQRAALLKTAGKLRKTGRIFDETSLIIWDQQLARLGVKIIKKRAELIELLRPYVQEYYEIISAGKSLAQMHYEVNLAKYLSSEEEIDYSEAQFLKTLESIREQEIERGVNLLGPHRDELGLSLSDLPVKGYASHGESWSYALALKLAMWKLLCLQNEDIWADDGEPILILDDVFAELDVRRRERLAKLVLAAKQVFITAAVEEDLPKELAGQKFQVKNGEVIAKNEPILGRNILEESILEKTFLMPTEESKEEILSEIARNNE
ncbi:MAG: DNA replication/repair protein RecF [Arcanobacterium sp.]|nr:DNA replication/repair protein RecF [Arcanobacterium sp.]